MPARARRLARFGLLAGLALLTGLLAWRGFADVGRALATAGTGLIVLALYHLVPLGLDALGWHALLPAGARASRRRVALARWIGESVNTLLPVIQIGGPVVRTRILIQAGVPVATAAASVVVDLTLIILPQILFTVLGIVALASLLGGQSLVVPAAVGTVLMAGSVAGFIALQRRGLFGAIARPLQKLGASGAMAEVVANAGELDARVREIYANRRATGAAVGAHLASWVAGTGEVWLSLHFLGYPVSLPAALLLESLVQAVRAAAFVVPGALGVQEGVVVLLGATLGLSPDTALALSLSKRCRELLLGVPGLVVWQVVEARGMISGSTVQGRGEAEA